MWSWSVLPLTSGQAVSEADGRIRLSWLVGCSSLLLGLLTDLHPYSNSGIDLQFALFSTLPTAPADLATRSALSGWIPEHIPLKSVSSLSQNRVEADFSPLQLLVS